MVTEFAEIDVQPGTQDDFIKAVQASQALFARAGGCHGLELHQGVENPRHFVLNIKWDDVAAHEAFRASPDFNIWRGNAGKYFAAPPNVWHGEAVV